MGEWARADWGWAGEVGCAGGGELAGRRRRGSVMLLGRARSLEKAKAGKPGRAQRMDLADLAECSRVREPEGEQLLKRVQNREDSE